MKTIEERIKEIENTKGYWNWDWDEGYSDCREESLEIIKEQQEEIEKLKKENSLMYNTLQDYKHDLPGQDYEDVCRILGQLNKQNNE